MEAEEFKKIRKSLSFTQMGLAEALGVDRRSVINYEKGNTIPESIVKLLRYLEKERDSPLPEKGGAVWVDFGNTMQVPLVQPRAQAGFLAGWGDPEYVDELPTIPWEVDKEYNGGYVCFEVSGDSMWDENSADSLFERDILLCREVQRHHWRNRLHIHSWKYFVVVHREKGILVKQISEHDTATGNLTLHSLNPYYYDQTVHVDNLIAIFNVVDIRRSARR